MDSAREILILLTLDSNKDKLIKLLERCAKLKTWPGYCFVVDISVGYEMRKEGLW